jgi:hypothetical protein
MLRRLPIVVVSGVLILALLACSNTRQPDASSAERATSLAQTAAALLTSTALASITPITPTLPPTDTPVPPTATPTLAPTNTPPPVEATSTPTPCLGTNDSAFVSDVNVPDGTHLSPGEAFTKTWRLRNDGDCTWTTAYQLRHIGDEAMAGAPTNLGASVPPGGTIDVSVALVAPGSNGTHISRWQLHSPEGTPFGARPYVEIIVP